MSSGVAFLEFMAVMDVVGDGISPSMAQCPAPSAIAGIVYMENGKLKNLHRVRHIEGVCEKIHKDTVRVGFWVGSCAGVKSADA